jgi:hypothetical protein
MKSELSRTHNVTVPPANYWNALTWCFDNLPERGLWYNDSFHDGRILLFTFTFYKSEDATLFALKFK